MKWNCYNNGVTREDIEYIELELKIQFLKDFLNIIKEHDGGYPVPNRITIDGKDEILNNLVSFIKDDLSFILYIIKDTENFNKLKLIPLAEDPFGNLFCYSFKSGIHEIVFWEHEKIDATRFVCNTFSELIEMLHY